MSQGKEDQSPQTQAASAVSDGSTVSLDPKGPAAPVVLPSTPNACAGMELGPVRLIAEIGRGGMGAVYRGHHKMLGRDVAVKLLHGASTDEATYAQFLREVRAAAAVHGPCLVAVHHADVHGGVPYLVMEHVHGATLKQVLSHAGPLSLSVVLAVLKDMAEALDLLHRNGVIHRDLKPSNVLLGSDGRALVADFGLALRRTTIGPGASYAAPSGTPSYMAPELFEGNSSPRSDVYALGILVFELLAGKPPFEGDLQAIRAAHQSKPLPVELLAARGIKPEVIEVIERAANKKPMFRYKTANDFLRALEQAARKVEPARTSELGSLALGAIGEKPPEGGSRGVVVEAEPGTPSTSYFDTIARLADQKRGQHRRQSSSGDEHATAEPDVPSLAYVEVPAIPVPPDAVGRNVYCISCGYDLLSARREGRCPECARSVADTLAVERALGDASVLPRISGAIGLLMLAMLVAWMPGGISRIAWGATGVGNVEWWVTPLTPLGGLLWLMVGDLGLMLAGPWFPLMIALAGWKSPLIPGLQLPPIAEPRRPRRRWLTTTCASMLALAGVLMLARAAGMRGVEIAIAPLLLPLPVLVWASFRNPIAVAAVTRARVARGMLAFSRWLLTIGSGVCAALAWVWAARRDGFRVLVNLPDTETAADLANALTAGGALLLTIVVLAGVLGLGLVLRKVRAFQPGGISAQVGP